MIGIPRDSRSDIEQGLGGRGRQVIERYILVLADILTEFTKWPLSSVMMIFILMVELTIGYV